MRTQTVAEFVERFLPEQYAELCARGDHARTTGAFGLNVIGEGQWSLIVHQERLEIQPSLNSDRVLTASVAAADFEALVLAELPFNQLPPLVVGQRVLRLDAETLLLVKNMPGSILVRIADNGNERRVLLTPGGRAIDFERPECTIECDQADLLAVRNGSLQPLDLFMAGKLRVLGDAQLALALGGLLV